MDRKYFGFLVDKKSNLLSVYIGGCVLSHISEIFNIAIFVVLCRRTLLSPVTILMQGLALADFLTVLFSYGLEPILLQQYDCLHNDKIGICVLSYPYCMIYTHFSILSMTFHSVSVILTTCIGIQKVIAILFPIWTKCNLSNKKAVICCIICFLVPIVTSIARHFSLKFGSETLAWGCPVEPSSYGLMEYSSLYYLFIQTALLTCCCVVMVICTVYIVYKLVKNKFQGRQTERRRQERRSALMVVVVLVVFLLSEVPKVCFYIVFCMKYITDQIVDEVGNLKIDMSISLIMKFEEGMIGVLMSDQTDIENEKFWNSLIIFVFLLESLRIFTLFGSLSNFIIYVSMSRKLRIELKSLCRKRTVGSTNIGRT